MNMQLIYLFIYLTDATGHAAYAMQENIYKNKYNIFI